jgi:fatty acid desaturase
MDITEAIIRWILRHLTGLLIALAGFIAGVGWLSVAGMGILAQLVLLIAMSVLIAALLHLIDISAEKKGDDNDVRK